MACTSSFIIDRQHRSLDDPAGIADIVIGIALTTIMDFEDSDRRGRRRGQGARLPQLAGPDARRPFRQLREGRARPYSASSTRTGPFPLLTTAPDPAGRSLMLVRNVGHLMRIDAGSTADGQPIPEGILDGMVTAAIALHDVGRTAAA
jgi:malate synthase